MEKEIQMLKEFIHEKFESHEELEALRFKRIDELLKQYGKESEGNSETIKRVHTRVDRIEQSIKTVKGFGTAIATALTAVGAGVEAKPLKKVNKHYKIRITKIIISLLLIIFYKCLVFSMPLNLFPTYPF